MKKTLLFLAFVAVATLSQVPTASSIGCAGPHPFKNGKCKTEIVGGTYYSYCGSVLAGETPNCAIYVE